MKNIPSPLNTFLKVALFMLLTFFITLTGPVYALPLKNAQPSPDEQIVQNTLNNPEDSVYTFVEKMPEFQGGEKGIIRFLNQNMHYPEEALKKEEHGRVIVQFVISKTGTVEKAKVLRGVSPDLDAEALRVIGLLPNWIPGEQNGQKVAVYRVIPVVFQKISPEDAWEVNEKTVVVIDNVKMPASFNISIINLDKFATVSVLKPFPAKEKSRLISKYGKAAENGVVLITSNKNDIQYLVPDSIIRSIKNEHPGCVEEPILPVFPGGEANLLKYIQDSIQYPFVAKRLKTQGKVLVRFTVDSTGKVTHATVARQVDYFLDKEAVRIVAAMPNWNPGRLCDQKMNFVVTVPVNFKLDLPAKDNKEWARNDKTIVLLDGVRLPSTFQLEWLRYENLASYKVLQPTSKEVVKKLKALYGHDAEYGVIVITSRK